jgi:hypothetical protein
MKPYNHATFTRFVGRHYRKLVLTELVISIWMLLYWFWRGLR